MQPVKKNQTIELTIESYTSHGMGIGRYEGFAIFVAGAAVGDVVSALVLRVEKNFAYAKILSLKTASQYRATPSCPCAVSCGGCCFQHISYEHELEIKRRIVSDALRKIGKLDFEVRPTIGSRTSRYRNKAQYPVTRDKNGRVRIGFYAAGSHRVVPCTDCNLQPEAFAGIVQTFTEFMEKYRIPVYDEVLRAGLVRHLYLRRSEYNGKIMVCIVINGKTLPHADALIAALSSNPDVAGILLNHNKKPGNVILGETNTVLYGDPMLTEELLGMKFLVSPLSFFQVNTRQAEKLYEIAGQLADLKPGEKVLDLYCGTGTIGLTMASRAGKLIGAEITPSAVEDARKNAEANGITNAEFFCADLTDPASFKNVETPDVLLIDPPRKGCDPQLILSAISPRRMVYISCDPATLARDLAVFTANGYRIHAVQPVDMFPRTAHVECAVLLSREKADDYVRISVHTKDLKKNLEA